MFVEAYNGFIESLEEINFDYGTSFTIQQAVEELVVKTFGMKMTKKRKKNDEKLYFSIVYWWRNKIYHRGNGK